MTNRELLRELKALRLELTALKAELAELRARPNVENHYHYHTAATVSTPPVTIPTPVVPQQPVPWDPTVPNPFRIIWGNTSDVRYKDTKPFTVTF